MSEAMDEIARAFEEPEDDEAWRLFTYQEFLRSYSDEDAIYDEYDKHRTG